MTTGTSDYGSTFTKGGSAPAPAIVVDFPEFSTKKINITNHGSGGKAEQIPSGLVEASDITLKLLLETGDFAAIESEMESKTISSVVVSNGLNTITGNGFYTAAKQEQADAQNPNAIEATVVVAWAEVPAIS
jgi:hypothetical protein